MMPIQQTSVLYFNRLSAAFTHHNPTFLSILPASYGVMCIAIDLTSTAAASGNFNSVRFFFFTQPIIIVTFLFCLYFHHI